MTDAGALTGRRILVTRAVTQAGRLAAALAAAGAEAVAVPLQRILPVPYRLPDPPTCAWLVFASANAVTAVAGERLEGYRIAAVGPGTATVLRDLGLRVDLQPEQADAASLAAALVAAGGGSALLIQGEEARPELAAGLLAAGWRVDRLVVYRAEPLPVEVTTIGHLDAIVVASAATARRLHEALAGELERQRAAGCRIVAIGPRTAAACAELGFPADRVAAEPTPEAFTAAVISALT